MLQHKEIGQPPSFVVEGLEADESDVCDSCLHSSVCSGIYISPQLSVIGQKWPGIALR
jgi:hypothetical protein